MSLLQNHQENDTRNVSEKEILTNNKYRHILINTMWSQNTAKPVLHILVIAYAETP